MAGEERATEHLQRALGAILPQEAQQRYKSTQHRVSPIGIEFATAVFGSLHAAQTLRENRQTARWFGLAVRACYIVSLVKPFEAVSRFGGGEQPYLAKFYAFSKTLAIRFGAHLISIGQKLSR